MQENKTDSAKTVSLDDYNALRDQNAALTTKIDGLNGQVEDLTGQVKMLTEAIASLLSRTFGRHTEALPALYANSLLPYFGLAGKAASEATPADVEKQEVKGYSRSYRPRKDIPEDLPRVDVDAEIPEGMDICPRCGSRMTKIREEISEKLAYEPARVYVKRIHIPVFACNACPNGTAITVPAPPQLIRGGIVDTGFVSALIVEKFITGVPVYRQHTALLGMGCPDFGLSSMYGWIITAYESCRKMMPLLYEELRRGACLHLDETPVQVHREVGKKDTQRSYIWCAVGGSMHPVVLFKYAMHRTGDVADEIIGNFQGFIQTDDYNGYDHLKDSPGIFHVFCLAHIRRKFADILKIAGKGMTSSISSKIVELIAHVYRHEKELRKKYDLSKAGDRTLFVAERKTVVSPYLDEILDLLRNTDADPKSKLGKAVDYALKCWTGMRLYLDCPDLTPDNNAAENAIRPYVIGRKNWLFCGSPAGAEASAFFYSLVESAKANGINPAAYIRFVIERSLTASTEDDYKALLPWNCILPC